VRVALDDLVTEVEEPNTISHCHGSWKDGALEYEVALGRLAGESPNSIKLIRRTVRPTACSFVSWLSRPS